MHKLMYGDKKKYLELSLEIPKGIISTSLKKR